jgi:hypothetical protein
MIATAGHIALIVPNFSARGVQVGGLGVYKYKGAHAWENLSGNQANKFFYVGMWG